MESFRRSCEGRPDLDSSSSSSSSSSSASNPKQRKELTQLGFGVDITKMGRAGRWLKRFLGMKKEKHVNGDKVSSNNSEDDFEAASFSSLDDHRKEKKRWSLSSWSYKFQAVPSGDNSAQPRRLSRTAEAETEITEGKFADAAAKAADAAVMAARAAVFIVQLTADSDSRRGSLFCGGRDRWAALKIQAVFRGFLARKALKALKGIVKLQSLIRGDMARKETAAAVQTMQALARARATARSQWPRRSLDKENGFEPCYRPQRSIERNDETRSSLHSKRYSIWDRMDGEISDASPKITEIDAEKPHVRLSKLNWKNLRDYDLYLASTAQSSPFFRSFTSYCDPTPTRSLCGECTAIDKHVFLDHPNYMASTQSFQAKSRSTSSPKQRSMAEWSRQRRISLGEIMAARNSVTPRLNMKYTF